MIGKVIVEGLGLGLLLVLVCAVGISRGAVALVHLYNPEVQERCVALGLTTPERIRRSSILFKLVCVPGYIAYVLVCVYAVNGARGFLTPFWQLLVILSVMNLIDRFLVDDLWVGHTNAWTIPGTEDLKPYITAQNRKVKWLSAPWAWRAWRRCCPASCCCSSPDRRARMFWDKVACVYDVFANVINRKANRALCETVAALIRPADTVLECACGTGLLTGVIAPRCQSLTATDFSANMLKRAEKKLKKYGNVRFAQADITKLDYPDGSFDAVVAANVIHLLDEPYRALAELDRVCKPGGRLIIPTYMNRTDRGTTNSVSGAIGKAGADFKREFTPETYRRFFAAAGYTDARYTLCRGRIPCAVAVLQKNGG